MSGPTEAMREAYRRDGHLTVPGVFGAAAIAAALADIEAWGREFIAGMSERQRAWYLERGGAGDALRKLDNPVFLRPRLKALAADPVLVGLVEGLIGPGVAAYFSQCFLKPPGGAAKPPHQDNFYFGPNDPDGTVTAWIALDDADEANGCLRFADGSNRGAVLEHWAPADEPFNLQIDGEAAGRFAMTPAPVPRGGVSFHHGVTLHASGPNPSGRPRRAMAVHYVNRGTVFATPALPYDAGKLVPIT